MKKRLFTSTLLALTAMFILPSSVWADEDVYVSATETTTWTFGDLTTNANLFSTITPITNGSALYARAYSSTKLGTYEDSQEGTGVFKSTTFTKAIRLGKCSTAADKKIPLAAKASTTIASVTKDGTTTENIGYGILAFNTNVAGTIYVLHKVDPNKPSSSIRIYNNTTDSDTEYTWSDGTNNNLSSKLLKETVSWSVNALTVSSQAVTPGTVFIADVSNASYIYAIRFVPSVLAPTFSRTGNTVTITAGTCNIDGATLTTYYTTDGSEPTSSTETSFTGTSGTVEVPSGGVTIKAITYATKDATTVYGAVATSDAYTFDGSVGYDITYELNGGTVSGNPDSYTAATETFTLTNPTKDGCTFAGWTGTDLSEPTMTVTITQGSTGNRSYTATWTENSTAKNITTPTPENGTFTLKVGDNVVTSADKDAIVTVTPTAHSGYELDQIEVTKTDGGELYKILDYTNKFTMPDYPVTVNVTFKTTNPSGDEQYVNSATTWTFSSLTTGYLYRGSSSTQKFGVIQDGTNNNLYARVYADASKNATFTVNALASATEYKFTDEGQTSVSVSKYLTQNDKSRNHGKMVEGSLASATISEYSGTGMLAFNTEKAGTLYIIFKGASGAKIRAYHKSYGYASDNTLKNSEIVVANTEGGTVLSKAFTATTSGGTFFIGDVEKGSCDIYALRFVPTHTVTTSVEGSGTITLKLGESTIDSGSSVEEGKTITIVDNADSGYQLATLTYTVDGGEPVDIKSDKTFSMLTGNVTVTATFEEVSGADVTLTENGTPGSNKTYVLSNGLVSVTISETGQVKKMTYGEKDVIKSDPDMGGLDWTTDASSDAYHDLSATSVTVKTNTSGMKELLFTDGTWSLGYIMRKGVSGLYTYASVKGSSTESLREARMKWRPGASFNYGWVSDTQYGDIPAKDKFTNATTLQDATFRFSDETIYTKYDWANYMKDDKVHGVIDQTNGVGAWVISPSTEWVNGGVQKQDLTVHADTKGTVLLQMLQSEHFGAVAHTISSGEKFFGPTLLYINSGNKEAMISDAQTTASHEVSAWPYTWFTNDEYPTRGTVSGTVTLSKDDFTTTKLQVVLADASADDPLQQSGGYQYATEVESTTGSYAFTIDKVRPGSYKVFVYALNGDATGTFKSTDTYSVTSSSIDVGTIAWTPTKYAKKLWQIGEADHSTSGFELSDQNRKYGLWKTVPTTLTYKVESTSADEKKWYYAQWKDNKGSNSSTSTWNVEFDCNRSFTSPLHLTIALAGASRNPTLKVKMNGNDVSSAVTYNDGAIYRSGVLSGKYGLLEFEIPASYMVVGSNTLALELSGGSTGSDDSDPCGLMYDCIKLETGEEIDFGEEKVVNTETTWLFGSIDKAKTYTTTSEEVSDGLYARALTASNKNFKYSVNEQNQNGEFGDGISVYISKALVQYSAVRGPNAIPSTSTAAAEYATGYYINNNNATSITYPATNMLAFNAGVPGTVYVIFKSAKNNSFRIYNVKNGTSDVTYEGTTYKVLKASATTATGELQSVSADVEMGGVFIGDVSNSSEIYGVRFVPSGTDITGRVTLDLPVPVGGTVSVTENETVTDFRTFTPGKTFVLTPTASSETYTFKKWVNEAGTEITEGVDETTKALTLTLNANQTVKAIFESSIKYAVTFEDPIGGTLVVNDSEEDIVSGKELGPETPVTITVTPDTYYNLSSLKVTKTDDTDTEVTVTDNKFAMPNYPVTITATFAKEEMVSEETTWVFNGYTTSDDETTCDEKAVKSQTDKLYNRSASSGRGFKFVGLGTSEKITFSDGDNAEITISKIASTPNTAKADVSSMTDFTAGTAGNNSTAFFAFNTTVPGTCYAYVKSYTYDDNGTTKNGSIRIYFGKSDGITLTNATTSSTDLTELKLTSSAPANFFASSALPI